MALRKSGDKGAVGGKDQSSIRWRMTPDKCTYSKLQAVQHVG